MPVIKPVTKVERDSMSISLPVKMIEDLKKYEQFTNVRVGDIVEALVEKELGSSAEFDPSKISLKDKKAKGRPAKAKGASAA